MGRVVDRRSLLLGAALLPLAACTADPSPAPPPPPPPPDPDDALRSAGVEREQALLAQYDAVLAAHPALAARLSAVREEHAEHLRALLGRDETVPAGPSDGPSPAASPSSAPVAPADPAAALAGLVGAEAATGAAHAGAALEAGGQLAGVLASLAASEATHRLVLG